MSSTPPVHVSSRTKRKVKVEGAGEEARVAGDSSRVQRSYSAAGPTLARPLSAGASPDGLISPSRKVERAVSGEVRMPAGAVMPTPTLSKGEGARAMPAPVVDAAAPRSGTFVAPLVQSEADMLKSLHGEIPRMKALRGVRIGRSDRAHVFGSTKQVLVAFRRALTAAAVPARFDADNWAFRGVVVSLPRFVEFEARIRRYLPRTAAGESAQRELSKWVSEQNPSDAPLSPGVVGGAHHIVDIVPVGGSAESLLFYRFARDVWARLRSAGLPTTPQTVLERGGRAGLLASADAAEEMESFAGGDTSPDGRSGLSDPALGGTSATAGGGDDDDDDDGDDADVPGEESDGDDGLTIPDVAGLTTTHGLSGLPRARSSGHLSRGASASILSLSGASMASDDEDEEGRRSSIAAAVTDPRLSDRGLRALLRHTAASTTTPRVPGVVSSPVTPSPGPSSPDAAAAAAAATGGAGAAGGPQLKVAPVGPVPRGRGAAGLFSRRSKAAADALTAAFHDLPAGARRAAEEGRTKLPRVRSASAPPDPHGAATAVALLEASPPGAGMGEAAASLLAITRSTGGTQALVRAGAAMPLARAVLRSRNVGPAVGSSKDAAAASKSLEDRLADELAEMMEATGLEDGPLAAATEPKSVAPPPPAASEGKDEGPPVPEPFLGAAGPGALATAFCLDALAAMASRGDDAAAAVREGISSAEHAEGVEPHTLLRLVDRWAHTTPADLEGAPALDIVGLLVRQRTAASTRPVLA